MTESYQIVGYDTISVFIFFYEIETAGVHASVWCLNVRSIDFWLSQWESSNTNVKANLKVFGIQNAFQ